MEDRSIEDSQITASSYYSVLLPLPYSKPPGFARLNNGDYWSTSYSNPSNPWIQVDFIDRVELYGIQTQGYYSPGALLAIPPRPEITEWVTMLQVQTGDSEDTLTFIKDTNGIPEVAIYH